MNFRLIKENLITKILGPAEKDRYRVIGFQRQVKNAAEVVDWERLVQVFYSSSEFPKSGGRQTGPVQNDITYRIWLTASKAAQIDLSIIDNEAATAIQRAAAIEEFQEASQAVDDSMDELFEVIFQILMDARNLDMGFDKGVVANRWVSRMQKDDPENRGEYVLLTGSLDFTLRTVEQVDGDKGTVTATIYDVTVDQDGDDVEKAGTSGNLGG